MTMTIPSFYKQYKMFTFTLYSMNNDAEISPLWTIPPYISKGGIHVVVEFEPLQSQTISNVELTHGLSMRMIQIFPQHVRAITHLVAEEPSMLFPDVQEDDKDDDDDVSSESNDDNGDYEDEGGNNTSINPLSSSESITK